MSTVKLVVIRLLFLILENSRGELARVLVFVFLVDFIVTVCWTYHRWAFVGLHTENRIKIRPFLPLFNDFSLCH